MSNQLPLLERLVLDVGELLPNTDWRFNGLPQCRDGERLAELVRAIISEAKDNGYVWDEVLRRSVVIFSQEQPHDSLLDEDVECAKLLVKSDRISMSVDDKGLKSDPLSEQLTWHPGDWVLSLKQSWLRDGLTRLVAWASKNAV